MSARIPESLQGAAGTHPAREPKTFLNRLDATRATPEDEAELWLTRLT